MAAQKIKKVYRNVVQTTDTTTNNIDIPIPSDTVCHYKIIVACHETTSGNEDGGGSEKSGIANNNGGTASIVAAMTSNTNFSASLAASTIVVSANSSNLRLALTGIAATTINWQYEVELFIN